MSVLRHFAGQIGSSFLPPSSNCKIGVSCLRSCTMLMTMWLGHFWDSDRTKSRECGS